MSSTLTLFSEKFSPSGGTAADGVKKLLGSPALTLLQTVIRETVQNTWDARVTDSGVRYQVRLRSLSDSAADALRCRIFAQLPRATSVDALTEYLSDQCNVVLEISDWGTRGLGGPTRADVVPNPGESSDFVNFVRNIGVANEIDNRGGTYGYGKSSLYSMSGCATAIIYSVANVGGRIERRLIACHLGTAWNDPTNGRMTGRHWWGIATEDRSYVEPLDGEAAAAVAASLEMPVRSDADTGTTVLVLAPKLSGESLESALGEIQETLVWFFWPKMLEVDGIPPICFEIFLEQQRVQLPHPEQFPPLGLFVEAYRTLKQGGPGAMEVRCERPRQLLGRCAVRRGFRGDRHHLVPPEGSVIPRYSAHIAVMRPIELVVRYIEGAALPAEGLEWAGVFICSPDSDVEQAFADSEPPAHDDWIPDKLPRGPQKTYVNVALRRLREIAALEAHPASVRPVPGEEQPSLAGAADRLGKLIPELRKSGGQGGGRRGHGRNGSSWDISEPQFVALHEGVTGPEAVFSVDVSNDSDSRLFVSAHPGIVMDGILTNENVGADGTTAQLLSWESVDGTVLTQTPQLEVLPNMRDKFHARVAIPPLAAVGLRVDATMEHAA